MDEHGSMASHGYTRERCEREAEDDSDELYLLLATMALSA